MNLERRQELLKELAYRIENQGARAVAREIETSCGRRGVVAEKFTPPEGLDLHELDGWTQKSVWKAFLSLGGQQSSCAKQMKGEIGSPDAWCAALKDQALGTDLWRVGGGGDGVEAGCIGQDVLSAYAENNQVSYLYTGGGGVDEFAGWVKKIYSDNHSEDVTLLNKEDDYAAYSVGGVDPKKDSTDDKDFQPLVVVDAKGDLMDVSGANRGDLEGITDKPGVEQPSESRLLHGEQWRPFKDVPGVPPKPRKLTKRMLAEIVHHRLQQLKPSGDGEALEVAAEWNPSLHPRDPETGQFIKRPWDISIDDLEDRATHQLIEMANSGQGPPDMNKVLESPEISIDGVSDDVDSVKELRQRAKNPHKTTDVPTNPVYYNQLQDGDYVTRHGEIYEVMEARGPEPPVVRQLLNDGVGEAKEWDVKEPGRNTINRVEMVSSIPERLKPPEPDVKQKGEGDVGWTSENVPLDELSWDKPDEGAWYGTNKYGDGSIIKYKHDESGEKHIARVLNKKIGGKDKLELANGDVKHLKMGTFPWNDYTLTGVWQPNHSLDESDFVDAEDSYKEIDLLEEARKGRDAADIRAETYRGRAVSDKEITVANADDVPEGAVLVRGNDGTTLKVTEKTDEGFQTVFESGFKNPVSTKDLMGKTFRPGRQSGKAVVNFPTEWWGDDVDVEERREKIRPLLDDVVAKEQDLPFDEGEPIDDETFEWAKDDLAKYLSEFKDKRDAEQMLEGLDYIGDDVKRAHAGAEMVSWGHKQSSSQIATSTGMASGVNIHEFSHGYGDALGFKGGSNAKDGETNPIAVFDTGKSLDDRNHPINKFGLKAPEWSDEFPESREFLDSPAYKKSEVVESVESEVRKTFTKQNFSDVDSVEGMYKEGDAGMVRLGRSPGKGVTRNLRVDRVVDDGNLVFYKLTDSRGNSHTARLESYEDDTPILKFLDEPDDSYFMENEVVGQRKSKPSDSEWLPDWRDPNEVLGETSPDSKREATEQLFEEINKAWYRQAVASDRMSRDVAADLALREGYSSKQAHETLTLLFEKTDSKMNPYVYGEMAARLVKYHPGLLEAFRHKKELSPEFKAAVNNAASYLDVEFRFPGVDDDMLVTPKFGDPEEVGYFVKQELRRLKA